MEKKPAVSELKYSKYIVCYKLVMDDSWKLQKMGKVLVHHITNLIEFVV